MPDVYFSEMIDEIRYVLGEAGRPLTVTSLCRVMLKRYGASPDDVLAALRRVRAEFVSGDHGLEVALA